MRYKMNGINLTSLKELTEWSHFVFTKPCTKLKEGAPSDVLYMTNIAGAFYLLVLGLSLATFVFLCELIVFYWNQGDVIVETKEAAVSHHCTSSNAYEAVDEPREDHSSTPVSHAVRPTYLD